VALKRARPDWRFTVLAPHDARSRTTDHTEHDAFTEVRFHYVWPRRWESLAGRGIMPAIRRNPAQLLAVPALLWAEYRAIRRLVAADRPSVIYAHWFTPQAVTAWPVARRARLPLVFTTHASDVAVWARFGRLGRSVVRSVTCGAARFTAVSQATLDRMRPFFDDAQWDEVRRRAAIVPMGVDLPATQSHLTGPETGQKRPIILFMGRLIEKKGVKDLVEAFAAIHQDRPEALLVIAGEGAQRNDLERRVRDLGIANAVRFDGFVSGAAKDVLYQQANVCVIPSMTAADGDAEGLPVTLLEALSYGKATIASDATNAAEIVTSGTDAIIYRAGDTAALRAAIEEVLSWSAHRSAAMSAAARETARRYDWSVVAEETAAFLLDPFVSA
jgi:glycosyltransferase involved in cell wall biosynthesis